MITAVNLPAEKPIRLIVLFGGQSAEHDVSCTTAVHVLAALDRKRYEIETVGITREGQFVLAEQTTATANADAANADTSSLTAEGEPVELTTRIAQAQASQQVVVLPLLHGPLGEDGTIQGMLELAGVPYVGAGVLGSAVAMDKAMAKQVLAIKDIPQTKWVEVRERELADDLEATMTHIVAAVGFPCFVKPANMGSSIGVSKAGDKTELASALAEAQKYDEMLVVEEGVAAREIEFAVLGNDNLKVSVPGEIVPGADFYDYEDKYKDETAKLNIPADLPSEALAQMQEMAISAYEALRVEGMARADFLYEEGGRGPLLNELNTIPGFTSISMYPKLWEASDVSYSQLLDHLVDLAIERFERRKVKRIAVPNGVLAKRPNLGREIFS